MSGLISPLISVCFLGMAHVAFSLHVTVAASEEW